MLEIQRELLVKTLEEKKQQGYDYLKKITAVDYGDSLELVYIIYSTASKREEVVKFRIDAVKPIVPTIIHVYQAADWYERELAEMFSITIKGRKVKRLLLEKWNGTEGPLRKSFVWGDKNYKRI